MPQGIYGAIQGHPQIATRAAAPLLRDDHFSPLDDVDGLSQGHCIDWLDSYQFRFSVNILATEPDFANEHPVIVPRRH